MTLRDVILFPVVVVAMVVVVAVVAVAVPIAFVWDVLFSPRRHQY